MTNVNPVSSIVLDHLANKPNARTPLHELPKGPNTSLTADRISEIAIPEASFNSGI